jgi:hypothetical protein
MAVPFDAPGSVAFAGDNLLVANQASLDNDAANWAILEIAAGEPGLPLSLPPLGPRHHGHGHRSHRPSHRPAPHHRRARHHPNRRHRRARPPADD